jgi:hypothetical protein
MADTKDISFDDLIPSKQQGTTTPSKEADISFDDLVPKESAVKQTFLEKSMEDYSKKQEEKVSAAGAFGASYLESVGATPGALLAARTAMAVPQPPWSKPVTGILGGIVGGYLSSKGITSLEGVVDEVFGTNIVKTREQQKQEFPGYSLAGQVVGGSLSPVMRPGLPNTIKEGALGSGIMVGVGAGQRIIEGQPVGDAKSLVIDAVTGAFTKPTKLGEKLLGQTSAPPKQIISSDIPPPPPKGATPEQKADFLNKVKETKAKRDAVAPLVETAIRNKETGEIERMGPKHDEARKAETIDTHEQGFVDDRGNFHERQAAVDQAKRAGQIPQDYVLENAVGEPLGLRSGDLRKVGDERFKITDQQPPSEIKPPIEEVKAPVTRQEHKDAIRKLEEEAFLDLEVQRQEALNTGNKTLAEQIEAQQIKANQQIRDLQNSMPEVQFGDKKIPTWEEVHDHLYGSRTVGQAFDRILSTDGLGTRGQRALLRILNESQFIRDADLYFTNDYLKYTDQYGKEQDAAGMYTGDNVHKVEMARDGDIRTLAHEAMHAGTQRLINLGNSVAATKLKDLQERFAVEHESRYQKALEQFQRDNIAPTIGELKAFERDNRKPYGFTNAHEFIAEAFTNKEFKQILNSIKSVEPTTGVISNLWQQFKDIVNEGLNIPKGERTVFDDVMDYGATLVETSKGFKREDGASTSSPSKVISSTGEIVGEPTKPDPRNVKDEKEFIKIATDIYEKHGDVEATKFFEGWQQFKKTWPEPVKEVEKFVGINLTSKVANERIVHNNTSDLKKLAGKDVNLEQLTYDIDKGVPLTGKAEEVATKFRTLMDDLGKRALENDVIKGWHENYVARNVVSEGNAPKGAVEEFMKDVFGYGKASGDGTKTTTKYGQERRLKTREDLVNHIQGINTWLESKGLDYRFKLKTDNLADIYKDYALSVEKAIENKSLITNIKQVRNVEGESLIKPITPEQPLPYGWKQMDHPDLGGFAIHPDLVAPLKFVFDSGPGMTMQALGTVSQVVKRVNVIGSFFHAKSLMEVLSSAKIPLWTPLKDAIVLPLVEKGVKAVTGKDLQLSAISKAVEQFKKGGLGDNVDTWIRRDGLQLDTPEDVSKGMLGSIGKFADTMIGKYGPKTRVLEKSMSTVEKYTLGIFDKYTWDYLHTGGKLMVADAYLEKARLQAAKEGKPFDEITSRKEIASFVNDSFGGLNWFEAARKVENEYAKRLAMAAYSPEGRRALQIGLFAPDWTISTIRAFTAALPKSLNPTKLQPIEGIKGMVNPTTKADYARLYQFKTALLYATLVNAINNMISGRDLWENKDPTRIEWTDGTSMQAMKHAMEPYHWIMDPSKTLSNKLGFIPKALIVGVGGLEYASPTAPKLVDMSAAGRLKAIGQSALPFQIQAAAGAPEGEGAKRALLGTMGFPVYGKTAEQNKLARAERELAVKENAWKYRDKEIKKGRMEWTPKHDREEKALEKRRQNLNKEAQ